MAQATAPAAPLGATGNLALFARYADVGLAFGVVGVVIVLVIPIPTIALDLLLCCQIALSLAVIMGTLYCNEPLDFGGFPSLLLFVTLFRLALNVASSRLILLQGDAGSVIQSFGDFVVGGNYVVGMTVFLILVAIQFVVITKGSGRVAEVAARFTLDAMPGKQMAIDADLNAGLIDEAQARIRRQKIEREASFFGAMDGASKFVRGDAIAGLLITAINILGGLAIGVLQKDMAVGDALKKYTLLTIGDGLVTQIPALLVSTGAGILVTRGASEFNLGQDLGKQLLLRARPIQITAVFLLIFALVPGLPTIPFGLLSAVLFFVAWAVDKKSLAEPAEAAAPAGKGGPGGSGGTAPARESLEPFLKQDAVELELGTTLLQLVDAQRQGDLLGRIAQIRKRLAAELGIVVPSIRVRDNLKLTPRRYQLRIRGAVVAEHELFPDKLLAINPGHARQPLQGTASTDPAFGLPAFWITDAQRGRAEAFGYTVVDATSVLSTHVQEVLRDHAADLLSRQDVQAMVERLKESDPAVVKDVVPNQITLPMLHRVLQGVLRERVPVRDIVTVLETLGDQGGKGETIPNLVEQVRLALAPAFVGSYASDQGKLHALALAPELESRLLRSLVRAEQGLTLVLTPTQVPRLLKALEERHTKASRRQSRLVLLCSAALRPHVQRLLSRALPKLPIVSYLEVPRGLQFEIMDQVPATALGDEAGGMFGTQPMTGGEAAPAT
ncbi:MAG: flagellar biosynthesis protein FlhA [Planctomycetota bacterium]